MEQDRPVLEALHISKIYRKNGRQVQAVSDVSLSVKSGEILGIVGESGSGKSTLLRQIARLEQVDEGEIRLCGEDITGKSTRQICQDLQMIFQNAAGSFDPRMKVKDSIDETLRLLFGLKGKKAQIRREELIRTVGLEPQLTERYPAGLSGGQCQRMAIARALAAKPKVLLCDEITSALDVSAQAQIVNLLDTLRRNYSLAVIFVSHDLALVSSLCDRIMVIHDGCCVEEGDTRSLIAHPVNEYTRQLINSCQTGLVFGYKK